ncbi:hypothetical protein DKX38_004491 [Salix brachista]|uniref:Histone deacetylase complex subunit SAP18 n=1 Tax=Salix brachista TaxID=2182728 RepID=A0A5N5NBR4_9ROSI|nr:hypothetical protein DKX38_004491 [Salix brachista]
MACTQLTYIGFFLTVWSDLCGLSPYFEIKAFGDVLIASHHKPEDFAVRGKEPKDEVQIYTWKDATLRELTDLVKEVAPEARRRNAKLSFAFVYPDKNGRFVLRVVGMTHSSGRRPDDLKALAELNFQIGDYLDVAIM